MPVEHKFVSSVPDVGGGTYVQPTHWNDDHKYPPFLAGVYDAGSHGMPLAWTNMPSAITELTRLAQVATGQRFAYDFTEVGRVRVAVNHGVVQAFASAAIGLQWSQPGGNEGSWWGIASGGTNAAWCGLGTGFAGSALAAGHKIGTWYPVNPSAVAAGFVRCRLVGFMGDGAIDPQFGSISVFVL